MPVNNGHAGRHSAADTGGGGTPGIAKALPGIIGMQLSVPISTLQDVVHDVARTRHLTHVQVGALKTVLDTMQKVAMQSQQISRLASGRLAQSPERLSLDAFVNQAVDGRTQQFRALGIEVLRKIHPVEVIVDPGLLTGLVEAAIDWAAELGQRIMVYMEIKNWPEHAVLVLKANQSVAATTQREEARARDNLSWYLLLQTAQVMGVMVERFMGPGHSIVMIEFPGTVNLLKGLTAVEVDTGGESSLQMVGQSPVAGHRVLLVSADMDLRETVKDICETMGLVLNCTPSTQRAVRFCELEKPHVIVIDERLRDHQFDELREDLVRMDMNFPFIEIATASNTVEMASWMGDSMTRVSRDSLATQLPSLLVLELGKAA